MVAEDCAVATCEGMSPAMSPGCDVTGPTWGELGDFPSRNCDTLSSLDWHNSFSKSIKSLLLLFSENIKHCFND